MTNNGLLTGFFVSLGAVVVCLVGATIRAKKHDVKGHIAGIVAMLVALLVTVVFAELVGQRYTFSTISMRVHLPIALVATCTVLAPLITGYKHWKGRATVAAHKTAIGVWLTLVALALGTGLWMLSTGVPREAQSSARPDAPRTALSAA